MDVFRVLLCLGLAVLLWRFQFRGLRPVRDFFLWGVDYPFHFLLTGTLILVIWGVLGTGFGLQGLFLDEDPLTQVLLGATVMLLFAAIDVHYVALGASRRGWWGSLRGLVGFLETARVATDSARPVQSLLANGFLERLTTADLGVIGRVARTAQAEPATDRAGMDGADAALPALLRGEAFRMLVAPAVILEKGFGLVFLVGVVPTLVIPLIDRDPMACVERLPWLVGVCLGGLLGIALGCHTTRWASEAAGWGPTQEQILAALRRHGDAAPGRDAITAAAGRDASLSDRPPPPAPAWLSWLTAFFAIHAGITLLVPEPVSSRWIDWPEHTLGTGPGTGRFDPATGLRDFPWLPLGVLVGEAAAAGLLVAGLRLLPDLLGPGRIERLTARWRSLVSAVMTVAVALLKNRRVHQVAALGAAALAVASVLITIFMSPEATRSVWLGLRGYASLGAMLSCWLGVFWLATHAAAGGGERTLLEQRAATLAMGGLAVLHALDAPLALVAPLAVAGAIASGSRTLAGLWRERASTWLRPTIALGLAGVAAASMLVGARNGMLPFAAAVWLGLAMLFLGSTALAGVASRQPALLYPLTVLLGFFGFAIPYAALGERWQSAMPAAGSIACIVALLAASYTIIVFARPRSTLLTCAGLFAATILLNGAALFVAPNEFKATFPAMDAYYALPVYLDSRDYFRDTTPTTSRLRNRRVTEDFDRLARQGDSERLATVYFTMRPLRTREGGGHAVSIDVDDPRGRLRAAPGDRIRLSAEEWFTIRIDGDDCIALAEEPFFRKIFPWFRYATLHMIRNGIIRGPMRLLARDGEPAGRAEPGLPSTTSYRLIAPRSGRAPEEGEVLGLRLLGLADDYRRLDAEYVLIALDWIGRVTAVRPGPDRPGYTVEFDLPAREEPLDEDQLRTMASWMERCHLDTLRPALQSSPRDGAAGERLATLRDAAAADGCLVLEDARTEAAVPVGVFLGGTSSPSKHDAAFADFMPTAAAIQRTIDATPPPGAGSAAAAPPARTDRFTLRAAHDRGLFASPDGAVARLPGPRPAAGAETVRVALYNGGRLRPGDRLILTWNGRTPSASGPGLRHGAVFELLAIGSAPAAVAEQAAFPPGAVWATLRPVDRTVAGRVPAAEPFLVGQWQVVQLLNNTEVLLAWKNLVGDRWTQRKPKLVIITVSGGGIRASVWASVVLRKLEATLGADFPYHVRLITGASGGMVAGSYYATSLVPPPAAVLAGGTASFADLHGTTIEDFVTRLATDQLDAVAGRMLFADLPATVRPFQRREDRGRTLEQTWIRWTGGPDSPLGRPLQSYAADERLGWRPSLIFTPMMVEDGRRLLVSNLDMAFATRNVGGLLIEPSSRKIERPTIQGGDFDASIHEEDDVFSLSAVEFFRLFPEAHDFQVTTAIRMSASFPWVSPAVNLPTLPPRRVVDAGYYDNYGVNLSALWLSKMSAWLEENTSGVLVVQVRDKVSQGARTEIDFDRPGTDDSLLDRLVWYGGSRLIRPGLQGISTPLIGVTNARDWTMAFRNDEQVDLQDLLFDDQRGRDFFRTVVFECPVDVSLNWKLTAHEKAILIGGFGRPDATPREELARVKDYMTGRDSYEFHKWRIDHRNDPSYQQQLKARYDEQLRALGITGTDRLGVRDSQNLYENVMKNLKRLELLADWWEEGREPAAAADPTAGAETSPARP